jgi:hypothetical protein
VFLGDIYYRHFMKPEFLEYLIRECVKEVLEAFPAEPETVGAPAPPAAGQGTADAPPVQSGDQQAAGPIFTVDTKGIWFLNPKNPSKPQQLQLKGQDPASLERELYRYAAQASGPRVKVASSTLREVPKVQANPNMAIFLYVGKQNEDEEDLYMLPAKTYQDAKAGSVGADVSADHPTSNIPPPEDIPSTGQKTMAPDIDENNKLREMLSSMIKEALAEIE